MKKTLNLIFTTLLLYALAYTSVAAAAPPPARQWFMVEIGGIESLQLITCEDSQCQHVVARYTIDFWGRFVTGTAGPNSISYRDGFGCSGHVCALEYSGDDGIFYQVTATIGDVVQSSDVIRLERWDNEVLNWSVRSNGDQLILTPEADLDAMRASHTLFNFWGNQQNFVLRWIIVAVVETLVLLALFGRSDHGFSQSHEIDSADENNDSAAGLPFKLIPMMLCVNLILYFVLAIGIGSWQPLVTGDQRVLSVISLFLAIIYLSYVYWFYATQNPRLWVKIGVLVVGSVLLAILVFPALVIAGFSRGGLAFGGVPVEVTIALAFATAVLLEGFMLRLLERRFFREKRAFITSLLMNVVSFGLLFSMGIMNL